MCFILPKGKIVKEYMFQCQIGGGLLEGDLILLPYKDTKVILKGNSRLSSSPRTREAWLAICHQTHCASLSAVWEKRRRMQEQVSVRSFVIHHVGETSVTLSTSALKGEALFLAASCTCEHWAVMQHGQINLLYDDDAIKGLHFCPLIAVR